jgi:DNA primase
MIPQETIEQIRQGSDIVQVIGEYLRLKKRGRNFIAICPFHTEKTPSFNVNPAKQIYHCFGCGKGGNVISFLIEHDRMSYVDAIRHLARKANITIKEEKRYDANRELNERIAWANQLASDYFRSLLDSKRYRETIEQYLIQKRGLSPESIAFFGLGLAGEEWDGLIKYAAAKDLSAPDLEKAGLAILSEKKTYFDRFRQRLMIPIFGLSGKPIAFGGRTLRKGDPVKYMNSPETPLYSKSNVLYGLNWSREHIREANQVFVVEGYFDFISLWQAGIKNVVASSGTAFTPQHARLLARFTDRALLFFDADSAGQNAAIREVTHLLDAGLEVKIIEGTSGEDPDTLTRKLGLDGILKLANEARGFIDFRVQSTLQVESGITAKARLVKEMREIILQLKNHDIRMQFAQEAAFILSVDRDRLVMKMPDTTFSAERKGSDPIRRYRQVEFDLLSALFSNQGSVDYVFEQIAPDDFDSRELSRLYSAMITQYRATGGLDVTRLVDNLVDPDFVGLATEIASIEWPAETIENETRALTRLMSDDKLRRIRARLQRELDLAERSGNQERANEIVKEMISFGLYADKT